MAKKPPLGSGARFKKLSQEAAAGGARDPDAVSASAGFKKYGKERMQQLSLAGRKRAATRKG